MRKMQCVWNAWFSEKLIVAMIAILRSQAVPLKKKNKSQMQTNNWRSEEEKWKMHSNRINADASNDLHIWRNIISKIQSFSVSINWIHYESLIFSIFFGINYLMLIERKSIASSLSYIIQSGLHKQIECIYVNLFLDLMLKITWNGSISD